MSKREDVLAALALLLGGGVTALPRNIAAPERVPPGGLVIQHDGEPGQPAVTMSPLTYHYQHRVELDVFAQGANPDAAFDSLLETIGARLATDRTLGGLCDWCEAEAPRPAEIAPEGSLPIKAATVGIICYYATPDPLG